MNRPHVESIQEALDPTGWVANHGDFLYRFALLRVNRPDEAEDLVQETFLAALRSRTSFSGRVVTGVVSTSVTSVSVTSLPSPPA